MSYHDSYEEAEDDCPACSAPRFIVIEQTTSLLEDVLAKVAEEFQAVGVHVIVLPVGARVGASDT